MQARLKVLMEIRKKHVDWIPQKIFSRYNGFKGQYTKLCQNKDFSHGKEGWNRDIMKGESNMYIEI